ncbi:MAG: MarR family winged helix-turn-helix transcriptional regulator [Pseudomonadales bacterium]
MNDDRTLVLNQFTPYRLVNLAKRVSDACNADFGEPNGVSVAEWRVLARLGEHDELSSRGLPDSTFMDKSRVSRAIASLEDKQLIQTRTDADDNRARIIGLSDSGRRLYKKMVPGALQWEASFLSALSVTELRDLLLSLSKLEAKLDIMK